MFHGLSFEQIFTYVTLSVTAAHKLVEVAKSFATVTKTDADDKAVGTAEAVLAKVDAILSYVPAIRLKAAGK